MKDAVIYKYKERDPSMINNHLMSFLLSTVHRPPSTVHRPPSTPKEQATETDNKAGYAKRQTG